MPAPVLRRESSLRRCGQSPPDFFHGISDKIFILTLAKRHWSVPLVDALRCAGAGGGGLANQVEAPVATEAQGTAKLRARLAMHRAIHRMVWGTAVCRCSTYKCKHSQNSKTHQSVKPAAYCVSIPHPVYWKQRILTQPGAEDWLKRCPILNCRNLWMVINDGYVKKYIVFCTGC